MEFSQNLGKFLRKRMQQQGLTISELAEMTTTSRSAMQSYLTGDSNPRLDTIELLCEIWDVTPNMLLCGELEQPELSEDMLLQQCRKLSQPIQTCIVQLLQAIDSLVTVLSAHDSLESQEYITQIQNLIDQGQINLPLWNVNHQAKDQNKMNGH